MREREILLLVLFNVSFITPHSSRHDTTPSLLTADLEERITSLSGECQSVRETQVQQTLIHDEKMENLRSLVRSLQDTVGVTYAKMSVLQEEKDYLIISTHVAVDKARNQLRQERRHTASLMFVIHSQVRTLGRSRIESTPCQPS